MAEQNGSTPQKPNQAMNRNLLNNITQHNVSEGASWHCHRSADWQSIANPPTCRIPFGEIPMHRDQSALRACHEPYRWQCQDAPLWGHEYYGDIVQRMADFPRVSRSRCPHNNLVVALGFLPGSRRKASPSKRPDSSTEGQRELLAQAGSRQIDNLQEQTISGDSAAQGVGRGTAPEPTGRGANIMGTCDS